MTSYKHLKVVIEAPQIAIIKDTLQTMILTGYTVEMNEKARMLILLSSQSPHVLAQQQFTKNEWSILLILLFSYPHYAPYEMLLASLTSLSPADCRKRLQMAQQTGSKTMRQELKPVHRALSGIRIKLANLSPRLKISFIRDGGYALMTSLE